MLNRIDMFHEGCVTVNFRKQQKKKPDGKLKPKI